MNPVRLAARSMLASVFVTGGFDTLRHPAPRAQAAKPVIERARGVVPNLPASDETVVRIGGAVNVAFGTTLLLGKFQRLSALVLAVSLVPTTFAGHQFWAQSDADAKKNQQQHFQKNLAMLGGLLFALLDRKGRPSLSYRAGKATGKAKRKASKQAAKAAKALPDPLS